MSAQAAHSIYSYPPMYTVPLNPEKLGPNVLDKNGEAGIKLNASMKAVSLGPVSTVATEPFGCMVNLHECSPLSSQPSSPESLTDLDEPRHLTHTCSSLIPSLLIDNPEQVMYTLEDNERARRASKAYQNFICEEPIMLKTRSEAYQQKYLRYMNKIASIDKIDHLSDESLICLDSYLSPCYRRNGIHFIKAYQKSVKEERIRRAQRTANSLTCSINALKNTQPVDKIEAAKFEHSSGHVKSPSPSWKEVQIKLTESGAEDLSRHLVSSERSTQESDRMCLDA